MPISDHNYSPTELNQLSSHSELVFIDDFDEDEVNAVLAHHSATETKTDADSIDEVREFVPWEEVVFDEESEFDKESYDMWKSEVVMIDP